MGTAFAGTFVYVAIDTQSTTGHATYVSGSTGVYSGITNIGMGPNVSMVAECNGTSGQTGIGMTSENTSVFQSSSFLIKWKQDVTGEAPPPVVYHHHNNYFSLGSQKGVLFSINGVKVILASSLVSFADGSGVNAQVSGVLAPDSASANGDKQLSFHFNATWQFDSVDSSGLITYKTVTPVINSPTVGTISQIWLTQTTPSGSALAAASVADDFYFSASSTPS